MPDFRAGLTDDDDLGQFPSAASPLTAAGIDPDEARANPALLRAAFPGLQWGDQFQSSFPGSDTSRLGPSASAASAGKAGGAGDGFQPPYYSAGQPEGPSQAKPRSAYDAPEVLGMPTPAGWMPAQAAPPPKAPKPLPAPVPAWTPAGAATPSLEGYERTGLDSLSKNADLATQAVQNVPTSSPEVDRLAAERAKLAPPALYNPQTGKMNPAVSEYDSATGQNVTVNPKPGVGSRIWRGVRGGLVGLLEGGIPGAALGVIEPGAIPGGEAYGAPNKAYTRAEERRGQQVESTDKSMATAFQNWKDQVDAARAKATEFRANATTGRDLTTGATGAINAATDVQKAGTEERKAADTAANNAANTPEAKNTAARSQEDALYQQRVARVTDPGSFLSKLPIGSRMAYAATGKIPDPRQPREATAEEINYNRLAAADKVAGVAQTSDRIAENIAKAMGRTQSGGLNDAEVNSIVAKATQNKEDFANRYTRNSDGSYSLTGLPYDTKSTLTPEQFQSKLDKFRTDANVQLAKKGALIDETGNVVSTKPANTPGAPSTATAAVTGAPPAGATGQAPGADGKMYWVNGETRQVLGPVEK